VPRPEQVAAFTALSPRAPITPAAAAAVVTSPAGGLKDVPPGVRCWVIATKFSYDTGPVGGELASAVLGAGDPRIEGVVLLGAGPVEQIGSAPLVVARWLTGRGASPPRRRSRRARQGLRRLHARRPRPPPGDPRSCTRWRWG
jgi:hypothetical protein